MAEVKEEGRDMNYTTLVLGMTNLNYVLDLHEEMSGRPLYKCGWSLKSGLNELRISVSSVSV